MENVYQHFRKEEHSFIDSVFDWAQKVTDQYIPYRTPFLDPRQQFIVQSIVGQYEDLALYFFGGYEAAERKKIYLAPAYFEPKEEDYQIELVEIDYPKKFVTLSHGQILGTLTGAGIKRDTIGDIITDGERWQFFVDEPIFPYLKTQMDQIGKAAVQLNQVSFDQYVETEKKWETQTEIVSSLRLDAVIAGVFHLSRGKVKDLISSGRVKINWKQTERPDTELMIHDVLSIRGFGRMEVREVQGRTKKAKYVLEIGVLDRNK